MHRYYDRRLFHVMSEGEMKVEYAPKEVEGVLLPRAEADGLGEVEKLRRAVDVTTPAHFIAAGFDVNFVGPEEDIAQPRRAEPDGGLANSSDEEGGDGGGGAAGAAITGERDHALYVHEETFCVWLDSSEFPFSYAVQRWWASQVLGD